MVDFTAYSDKRVNFDFPIFTETSDGFLGNYIAIQIVTVQHRGQEIPTHCIYALPNMSVLGLSIPI